MKDNPLGKKIKYQKKYDPSLLFALPRKIQREKNGIVIKFEGFDLWHAYEFSYLGIGGKPESRILNIIYSSDSINIVESKSLKLYLNGFAMNKFINDRYVLKLIGNDLKKILITDNIKIFFKKCDSGFYFTGINKKNIIDKCNIKINKYAYDSSLLKAQKTNKKRTVIKISNLLKTNCPITGQPDWATVYIKYRSNLVLTDSSLLQYIVSYRNEADYHENCCEKIFNDIYKTLNPDHLTVKCFYTRRGGIDINPVRYYGCKNPGYFEHFWRQ